MVKVHKMTQFRGKTSTCPPIAASNLLVLWFPLPSLVEKMPGFSGRISVHLMLKVTHVIIEFYFNSHINGH